MFKNMDEIRGANRSIGHHWFDKEAQRFFQSRVGTTVYGGYFFTSSEQGPNGVRAYSLRGALPDGSIQTVGPFQHYDTREEAVRDAKQLAVWNARPYRAEGDGSFCLRVKDALLRDWYISSSKGQWWAVGLWGAHPGCIWGEGITPVDAMNSALRRIESETFSEHYPEGETKWTS